MSETHSAEKGVCDGCQKRPCVCETVVLPSAENDAGMHPHLWCPSEFPNRDGRCPACGYRPERLTAKGMVRSHRTRVFPPGRGDE